MVYRDCVSTLGDDPDEAVLFYFQRPWWTGTILPPAPSTNFTAASTMAVSVVITSGALSIMLYPTAPPDLASSWLHCDRTVGM